MKDFDYETLIICLEQKNLFMKDILNLTKRIEVEAGQQEVNLDNLLPERQNRIERIQKCDKLIKDLLANLDRADSEHFESLLSGKASVAETEDERKISELSLSTREFLDRTLKIDESARTILAEKREEARRMLAEIKE